MIEILYYDRKGIYKTLAESLVIGGLPMRTDNFTGKDLEREIEEVIDYINLLDTFKDIVVKAKDENEREYLTIENGGITCEKEMVRLGKYYRRGKALGQVESGSGHNSLYKGVSFNMVIKFPLYWLKQYQRYHFTDVISSQSTMHKILEFDLSTMFTEEVDPRCIEILEDLKNEYNDETDKEKKKEIWRKLINSTPDGLHMCMGIQMNYLQAISMYHQRKNHKLEEWRVFCEFLYELPLFKYLLIK